MEQATINTWCHQRNPEGYTTRYFDMHWKKRVQLDAERMLDAAEQYMANHREGMETRKDHGSSRTMQVGGEQQRNGQRQRRRYGPAEVQRRQATEQRVHMDAEHMLGEAEQRMSDFRDEHDATRTRTPPPPTTPNKKPRLEGDAELEMNPEKLRARQRR